MGMIRRAIAVIAWYLGVGVYILVISSAGGPIWEFMQAHASVTSGPFWGLAQRYKLIATTLVPALLILSPVVYWIWGNIREESSQLEQQVLRP